MNDKIYSVGYVFLLLSLIWGSELFAQNKAYTLLKKADSLFVQKKYSNALHIYEDLYHTTQIASPNMLLKMAFINEGLGDYTKTLYYLSLYYLYVPNSSTLQQMKVIAEQNRLKGYEYSDLDILKVLYQRYFFHLIMGASVVCLVVFLFILYRFLTRKKVYTRYKIIFMMVLMGLFFLVLFSNEKPKAIIAKDNTQLMSSPSAGSELVRILQKGHKVSILEKKDIWYKIQWENQTLYVRQSQLLLF